MIEVDPHLLFKPLLTLYLSYLYYSIFNPFSLPSLFILYYRYTPNKLTNIRYTLYTGTTPR